MMPYREFAVLSSENDDTLHSCDIAGWLVRPIATVKSIRAKGCLFGFFTRGPDYCPEVGEVEGYNLTVKVECTQSHE